jgi:hypothetical protein
MCKKGNYKKPIMSKIKKCFIAVCSLLSIAFIFVIIMGYPFVIYSISPRYAKCGKLIFKNVINLEAQNNFTTMTKGGCCNSLVLKQDPQFLTLVPAWYITDSELHAKITNLEFILKDFRNEYIVFNNDALKTMAILSIDLTKRFASDSSLSNTLTEVVNTIDSAGWQRDKEFTQCLITPTSQDFLKYIQKDPKKIISWHGAGYNIQLLAGRLPYAMKARLIIQPIQGTVNHERN